MAKVVQVAIDALGGGKYCGLGGAQGGGCADRQPGAITRAGSAVLARATEMARTPSVTTTVLARVTESARSLGIPSTLGLAGDACASKKCNKSIWETGRQVRETEEADPPVRSEPVQSESARKCGRGYCVRASRGVHMTCTCSRCCRGWRAESRLLLKTKVSWALIPRWWRSLGVSEPPGRGSSGPGPRAEAATEFQLAARLLHEPVRCVPAWQLMFEQGEQAPDSKSYL